MDKLSVTIFSYNRACQLHACIESFMASCVESDEVKVNIVYKYDTEEYKAGYVKLKEAYSTRSNIVWHEEKDFKAQTKQIISDVDSTFTMFLVDDIIFVDRFSIEDSQFSLLKKNSMLLAVSLRLHDGVSHCYATNKIQQIPRFVKNNVWLWKSSDGDWGYPMSVDGNVFKTDLIKNIVSNLEFNNPNTFEAALDLASKNNNVAEYMCCYVAKPKLINIPANRVQDLYKNRFAEGLSSAELNKLYLQGKTINIESYQNIKPNTVHVPVEIKFVGDDSNTHSISID